MTEYLDNIPSDWLETTSTTPAMSAGEESQIVAPHTDDYVDIDLTGQVQYAQTKFNTLKPSTMYDTTADYVDIDLTGQVQYAHTKFKTLKPRGLADGDGLKGLK